MSGAFQMVSLSQSELERRIENILKNKSAGKKIVFTNGVFDLVHPGHIKLLEKAKELGDFLCVALNTDSSVKKIKGEKRPITPLYERVEIIEAFDMVDEVVWFNEDTPYEIIKKIKPDVIVKGGDYEPDEVVGKDIVESYGGKVVIIPLKEGFSTSSIIENILKNF